MLTETTPSAAESMRLASWVERSGFSALQETLALAMRPGLISFGPGLPAEAGFPVAELKAAAGKVLREDPSVLQYAPPLKALQEHICELMRQRGVDCDTGEIFITSGAQQALNLLSRLLLDCGTPALVEDITYTGLLHAIGLTDARVASVGTDFAEGVDTDAVQAALDSGCNPGFLYVIPDGHNPLGVSLPREKRFALVELARRYKTPIVEDDPYGLLYYGKAPLPPLRSLDKEWIIYTGSFSKTVAPALRAGWIVCPRRLTKPLAILKEATDANVATLGHRILNAYLDTGALPGHVEALRREYRQRRDHMLFALERFLPAGARFSRPASGLFVWVELPGAVDTTELLRRAVEECGVAFVPGAAFATSGERGRNCLRLNFSHCDVSKIEQGVRLLAAIL
jgi:2-aminoadipate transaminase